MTLVIDVRPHRGSINLRLNGTYASVIRTPASCSLAMRYLVSIGIVNLDSTNTEKLLAKGQSQREGYA